MFTRGNIQKVPTYSQEYHDSLTTGNYLFHFKLTSLWHAFKSIKISIVSPNSVENTMDSVTAYILVCFPSSVIWGGGGEMRISNFNSSLTSHSPSILEVPEVLKQKTPG